MMIQDKRGTWGPLKENMYSVSIHHFIVCSCGWWIQTITVLGHSIVHGRSPKNLNYWKIISGLQMVNKNIQQQFEKKANDR